MAFIWVSKRSGQRAKGGGCIGCVPIPIGCAALLVAIPAGVALLWRMAA